MTRRILTVALAIVLAIVGTGAVLLYVRQANQRALDGQSPVTVLVAAQPIPAGTVAGTALSDGLLTRQTLPAKSVPADAVKSITPALRGLVLSGAVPSGELLLRPMLVTSETGSSGLAIPAKMIAVTIPMCIPQAVADFIYPQAQVAVFDTVLKQNKSQQPQASCTTTTGGTGNLKNDRTWIVLPRVTILAVGQASSGGATGSTTSSGSLFNSGSSSSTNSSDPSAAQGSVMVTLAVSQADAERLITLAEAGTPWLALLSSSSQTGADMPSLPMFPAHK